MAGKRKREDFEEKPKPADWWDNPNWQIEYINPDKTGKLSRQEQELQDIAILQKSPFHAKGQPENALDTYHVVTPQLEWNLLRKYSNFISKCLPLQPKQLPGINDVGAQSLETSTRTKNTFGYAQQMKKSLSWNMANRKVASSG